MPVDTDPNRQNKTPEPRQFGSSLIFLFWLPILLNLFLFRGPQYRQVPYSQFIEQVETGKVVRAVVGSDRIQYELKSESTAQPFTTPPQAPPEEKVFVTTPVAGDVALIPFYFKVATDSRK